MVWISPWVLRTWALFFCAPLIIMYWWIKWCHIRSSMSSHILFCFLDCCIDNTYPFSSLFLLLCLKTVRRSLTLSGWWSFDCHLPKIVNGPDSGSTKITEFWSTVEGGSLPVELEEGSPSKFSTIRCGAGHFLYRALLLEKDMATDMIDRWILSAKQNHLSDGTHFGGNWQFQNSY